MKPKPTPSAANEQLSLPSKASPFLNDLLDYCSRQGLLSQFEQQILIKFKVDGFSAKETQDRQTALSEGAVHVRVHRIMQRLQAAALVLGTETGDSNQRCRPNLADPAEKNSRGHERFFFETFCHLFAH